MTTSKLKKQLAELEERAREPVDPATLEKQAEQIGEEIFKRRHRVVGGPIAGAREPNRGDRGLTFTVRPSGAVYECPIMMCPPVHAQS